MGEVVIGRMQARLQEAAASATTPQEGLHAMVSVYLQMAESSPHVYAFVTRDGPFDPIGAAATARRAGTGRRCPGHRQFRGASRFLRQRDGDDRSPAARPPERLRGQRR